MAHHERALGLPFRTAKAGVSSRFGRIAAVFALWSQRRRTRAALRALPEHMLRDIGLTRSAADAEARRPFWDV
jgi:uncharacterized protein YjiS (DUF1127 family)